MSNRRTASGSGAMATATSMAPRSHLVDVASGQKLYRAANVRAPLTPLLDGRMMGQKPARSGSVPGKDQVEFVTLSRTGEDRRVRVGGPREDPDNPLFGCYFEPGYGGFPAPARGGRRAAGSCIGNLGALLVWDLETGLRLDTGPRREMFYKRVVAISPAGTEVLVFD